MLAATPLEESAMLRMVANAFLDHVTPAMGGFGAFCEESEAVMELARTCWTREAISCMALPLAESDRSALGYFQPTAPLTKRSADGAGHLLRR